MRPGLHLAALAFLVLIPDRTPAADGPALPPVSERARRVHAAGMLFDGHNDLPWRLREAGDVTFEKIDLSKRLRRGPDGHPPRRAKGA